MPTTTLPGFCRGAFKTGSPLKYDLMEQIIPVVEILDRATLLSHLLSLDYPYIPLSEKDQINNGCIG